MLTENPNDWPLVEKLATLVELSHQAPEHRARFVASKGLTFVQLEQWRLEILEKHPGLVRKPRQRR